MAFTLFFTLAIIPLSTSVLPKYTPPLARTENSGRLVGEVIQAYFTQGYENAEILGFLALVHGVVIGMRTLKRWLSKMELRRPHQRNEDPLEDIVSAILAEMDGCVGSFVGYREMTRRLKYKHNLNVRRDTVMRALQVKIHMEFKTENDIGYSVESIVHQDQILFGTLRDGTN